ncbi:hypothetical protein E2C01_055937 [Portunus trituberculatus]|uniref:Uncharacterized protein n=1 Tax=Portunus trituberculatus TaxID=210409 RepID=A0A5B7GNU9_PORTR|nr:hypothetical protein [Portunus trituberculatus]
MTSGEGTDSHHSGMDYNQLMALAKALNFNIRVLPSRNWDEAHRSSDSRSAELTYPTQYLNQRNQTVEPAASQY